MQPYVYWAALSLSFRQISNNVNEREHNINTNSLGSPGNHMFTIIAYGS